MTTPPPPGAASPSLPPPVVPPSTLPPAPLSSDQSTPASDLLITAVVTTQPAPPAAPVIDTVPAATLPTLPATAPAPAVTPPATVMPAPTGSDGEVQVRCPNCETVWEGSDLRPHAQWFCGNCDYPLFWAVPPKADRGGGGPEGDGALARLPGTDGRETLSSLACPHCGERNLPDPSLDCLRCGLPLTVRHDVVIEPEVITVVQTQVLPPLPARKRRLWPSILVAIVLAAAVATATYFLVRHYR